MTNIKIFHNSILRKFSISNSAKWSDLEEKIRMLFTLSPTSKFTLSYTDEEEDIVTISTDLELQELLSNHGATTIKFTLNHEVVVNTAGSTNNETLPLDLEKMDINDESIEYELQQQREREAQQQREQEAQKQRERETQKEETMVSQFQDVVDFYPVLAYAIDSVTDEILQSKPIDIELWRECLIYYRQEKQKRESSDNNDNSTISSAAFMSEHPLLHQYVSPLYFTSSTPSNNSDNVSHRDPLSRSSRSIENIGGSRNNHGPSLEEICIVNTPLSPPPRKVSVDESNFDDKVKQLCEMGFWGDEGEMIKLLKAHNGNIGKVVEELALRC
nr:6973_t:CDS:2 [Entrophospora candida]